MRKVAFLKVRGVVFFYFSAHPFPHMGDIVTVKLSETYEDEVRPDGTCQRHRVETYFQVISAFPVFPIYA